MNTSLSLRVRLTVGILVPLVIVATLIGAWAYRDAQQNAAERFDRSLLSTALAISRDIAVSGGDALREETRDLLRDTSGGSVFYHVYAPDGVFVTGYATPPVPPEVGTVDTPQTYYDAIYLGDAVRSLRFTQQTAIDGLVGPFTFTVWQATSVRDGFVRSRTVPVFAIITSLIGALTVIVWFGVGRGLAPLLSLEDAIARRSVDDLSPIKRSIPHEVTGIVGRFNALLAELSASMEAKNAFISDATHQLRNPIAGVIALADSVAHAKDPATSRTRAADLLGAAQDLGHLSNSLLTLERIKDPQSKSEAATFDAAPILSSAAKKSRSNTADRNVQLVVDIPQTECLLKGDAVMFEQAVLNLLDNAAMHGGPKLTTVSMKARERGDHLVVEIADDGKGIAPQDFQRALGRFSQVGPSAGSGLGLPICAAVVRTFGGTIELNNDGGRFTVTLRFPTAKGSGHASA